MKKLLLMLIILIVTNFTLCYSQTRQNNDNDVLIEVEGDVENIYDSIQMKQVTRFGSGLPAIDITRSRLSTDEEFIFKTYIMDKLLKSNRILY